MAAGICTQLGNACILLPYHSVTFHHCSKVVTVRFSTGGISRAFALILFACTVMN